MIGRTEVPHWMKSMGGNAPLLKGCWERLKGGVLAGKVPILLKELIMFTISIKRGSPYCESAHAHSVLQLDKTLTFEDLMEISQGKSYKTLPKAFQVAIEVIGKAGAEPDKVTESDFDRLHEAGFTEEEIAELVAQADICVMFNTYTNIVGLPIDAAYHSVKTKLEEARAA
ncbi:MAG: carboxymuconolactone decarboxylase family protein [Betaproteobacteria bacterium]|nr:carboxymuconolactone decarboxylase family protein [Betaproteobacteria bacterium]